MFAFVASLFFFICGAFSVDLGDVNVLYAGLSSAAAGFVLDHLP
jgi:hypothetical protein